MEREKEEKKKRKKGREGGRRERPCSIYGERQHYSAGVRKGYGSMVGLRPLVPGCEGARQGF